MLEQNRALVHRIVDELFNNDRFDLIDELYCDDMINHDVSIPNQPNSKQEIIRLLQFHRRAFPDLSYTLKTVLCEGNKAAFHWTVAGTHSGPLGDIPATGNRFEVEGMSFIEIQDGKVRSIWQQHDTEATYSQLGISPKDIMPD